MTNASTTDVFEFSKLYQKMMVGGEWRDALSGKTLPVENPARRQIVAQIPAAGSQDVDHAVKIAGVAFENWMRRPPKERGLALLRIADELERQAEQIARVLTMETGNAIRTQARPEVRATAEVFRYFGGLAGELKGETVPLGESVLSYTRRQPLGVVAAIIPWNAPLQIAALKIAPALCAGNTVVLKASEDASLAVLHFAAICQAHLPPGVLNVLTGLGQECGAPLVLHPDVRKLSFTGSTQVGKSIMKAAAEQIIPVSLELGGKSPSIVFADCDEEWVVEGVIAAMRFTRQGQSCTAGSRLLLHANIFDSFLEKLVRKTASLRVGDPLLEETEVGSLISCSQHRRVMDYLDEALANPKARLLTGGRPDPKGPLGSGWFALPTILSGVERDWRIAREEVFGPVLVALPWRDEAEVVKMANDTHYGLAAYLWTHDIGAGLRVAHAVDAGWVQVNQGGAQQLGQSFGGTKASGMGRECSLEGMLDSFTERKSVTVNLNSPRG